MEILQSALVIFSLAYIQSISFSIVSRSRNRDNMRYHIVASVFSNSIWFLTFRHLVKADMSLVLFVPYTFGTVLGSLTGVKVAMWIESKLGATSDGHLKKDSKKKYAKEIEEFIEFLEKRDEKLKAA